ncbi:ASST-domain-containing protein, partial [Phyllosticta citricarpa]
PDLRAPKLAVRVVNRTAVSPGYHFVAPYNTNNDWESHKTPLIEACQVGPHIYDNNGELIWSGACLFRNENGFDFKAIHYNNKTYLSLDDVRGDPSLYGAGIILSDQYQIIKDVQMAEHTNQFDQHEFAVIEDGKIVLYAASDLRDMDGDSIGLGRNSQTRVHSTGFKEVDISGENPTTIFDWQGADHVPLEESTFAWPEEADPYGRGWDYLHMNSVDKFPNGDYLVSFRYTNSLMRLSGENGDILWRLGGKKSDFDTKDFVFSRQHHGRIITSNETHTVLSFFDNASSSQNSDHGLTTADRSSARVILLSHDPNDRNSWTATSIRHFERPDRGYTRLRGSVQILASPGSSSLEHDTTEDWPNSNVFISWSDHGYATEFSPNGEIVMETQFVSRRFDTYRAFKMVGFVGRPTEPPALKALVYGDILPGQGSGVGPFTVVYISWNGATEVRAWRVYGKIIKDAARFAYLGTYRKTGFETAITIPGAVSYLWAEALDSEGNKIGQTSVARGIVPGVSIASWDEAESTNSSSTTNSSSSSSTSDLSLDFDTDADAA